MRDAVEEVVDLFDGGPFSLAWEVADDGGGRRFGDVAVTLIDSLEVSVEEWFVGVAIVDEVEAPVC